MEPIYTVARRLPKKATRTEYDLLNSLLATVEREICFFYKLYNSAQKWEARLYKMFPRAF